MARLMDKTVVELKQQARNKGLRGYSTMNKQNLISLLTSSKKVRKTSRKSRKTSSRSRKIPSKQKSKGPPFTKTKRSSRKTSRKVRIPPLKKNELGKYGYHDIKNLSVSNRHKSIDKAIKEYGGLSIFRKLNVLSTFLKRSSPKVSSIAKKDRDYIKRKYYNTNLW